MSDRDSVKGCQKAFRLQLSHYGSDLKNLTWLQTLLRLDKAFLPDCLLCLCMWLYVPLTHLVTD